MKPKSAIPHSFFTIIMKKLILLAAGFATLSLGACNRQICPAYSSSTVAKPAAAPITASTATPAERQ
ncbi:hypothetical protein BEN48_15920 [Hymenobacter glacialis]|uniref:Lipoprotein n=2 Tax=Hymenobacter glacialis TaxID=1908236 RepID=A0A1G1T0W6_9BACT|nr:hypothetical protein BEN48_15920 [Hymenobacter glacialis]